MTESRVKPDRWREMERIFLAALDRQPAERGAYLDEAGLLEKALGPEPAETKKAAGRLLRLGGGWKSPRALAPSEAAH